MIKIGAIASPLNLPRRRQVNRLLLAYLLIAPVVLWRGAVTIYPFLRTVQQSLTNESPLTPVTHWVGLQNFQTMLSDPVIRESIRFTAVFTIASTVLQLVYALGIASLLNRAFPGRTIVRAVNLLPWAMPTIVIATAAQWLFHDQYGMIDDVLVRFAHVRPVWLASPVGARAAVILLDTWKNAPWASIILLAGLQNIPSELFEAARVDGASRWRTFRSVTLPLLAPVLITLTIFIAAGRILTFDLVYGFTQGGPGVATSLLSYQVYKLAFSGLYYGYGSAVAVFAFLMVAAVALAGYLALRRATL